MLQCVHISPNKRITRPNPDTPMQSEKINVMELSGILLPDAIAEYVLECSQLTMVNHVSHQRLLVCACVGL